MGDAMNEVLERAEILSEDESPQARARRCWAEVQAVLIKHGYQLVAVPSLTPEGRIIAQAQLQPVE